ncbi:MAG TPA: choice-of-anchor tandem repeat GloVer-containing protein [Steroidobacteraceae bacterium]|nr:choice-of-anchor tandem repeat GloVer-containing protein [Steroidobacteraceae bacterium]
MDTAASGQLSARRRARTQPLAGALLLCALGTLGGCSGDDPNPFSAFANLVSSASVQDYSLAATLSGLNSSGLVLLVNATAVSVRPGVTIEVLASALSAGSSYTVTIQSQPTGETCAISGGTGTIQAADVTSVAVSCTTNSYTVGGSISGLTAPGLVLLDNGGDALSPGANDAQFTMPTAVAYGASYAVTVQAAPAGLVCAVSNGSGTMGAADVTGISVACVPNFTLLYSFAGGTGDGVNPYHTLIQASDGNFYGTTFTGGAHNGGIIYEVSPSGAESLFYSFTATPFSVLMQGSDGNFYGTTAGGGTYGRGTVFVVTPSGTETTLFSFPSGSSNPYTGVIEGSDGNFYGTTGAGGATDEGTVFKLTSTGTLTILHSFPKTGSDGEEPYAGVIEGSDGNFYGTTYFGGTNGTGTVFKVTPDGVETVLYSFAGGGDAANPYSGLIQGSDGDFYGTTYNGGAHGFGTVYQVTPGGGETVLYSFAGGTTDGANPEAGVIQGIDGNFYGSTYAGGPDGVGTIFELSASGTETILHSFAGGAGDGANPSANLVQASDGTLYGSSYAGGAEGHGTFFKVALQSQP